MHLFCGDSRFFDFWSDLPLDRPATTDPERDVKLVSGIAAIIGAPMFAPVQIEAVLSLEPPGTKRW